MKYLTLSFPTPADNLACDEALLDACDAGGDEVLRFWESQEVFVVVGYGNSVATEANVNACQAKGVPILRRCTGGGTVVQGPGCFNYSLIARTPEDGPLRTITSANQFIMERQRVAMERLLAKPVQVCGHTDLATGGLKFSGNAQRRKKNALLFHGTLLLNFDLGLISELLPMPSRQPDYRANRSHTEFITNLNLPATAVISALQQAWNAHQELTDVPHDALRSLVQGKYGTDDWNLKF